MSTTGGGEVVVLPHAALGTAAGVALLATGGVAVYQTGKGIVACGRKIHEAIEAHAARQRAINQLCARYEEQVQQSARQASSLAETAGAQKRATLLQRFQHYDELARAPEPEPIPAPPPDVGLEEEPPPMQVTTHADLDRTADHLFDEIEALDDMLDALDGEAWAGLVDVADMRDRVEALRQAIAENRRATESPDRLLRDLRQECHVLRAEISYRAAEGRARHARRRQTAELMGRAATRLAEKTRALAEEPDLVTMLRVAETSLTHADEAFNAGNLAAAEEHARLALDYVEHLVPDPDTVRRSNLEVAIKGLREFVAGFDFPPNDPAPVPLETLIERAESRLAAGRFDECWTTITAAQEEAERLADLVTNRLETYQRDGAIALARDALADMDYTIGEVSVDSAGVAEFRAERADGAYFRIRVTPDGLLRYKAEHFGTAECKAETKRFFETLEARGMMINTQSEFNLAAAAERMREILLRQGFDLVEEETAPDGKTRIITAQKHGGETVRRAIDHDSAPLTEEPTTQTETPARNTDVDRARRAQQETYRRYMEQMRAQMRRIHH